MIGSTFGSYRVLDKIGQGGMGEVYRARDVALGRDVAIKILPPAVSAEPERRSRFEREAKLLASLNHPNIGAIYGLVDVDSGRGLVLEFVEGPTLEDVLHGGGTGSGSGRHAAGLPITRVLEITRQIADALDAAHERGIVHRDLKPANVKLTGDGTVKVLDFGLATEALSERDVDRSDSSTVAAVTEFGTVLGTVAYMSPEQARGRPVDKRTDVWAFGCVLFEMLSGRRPFAGETAADTISAILEREPDWPRVSAAPGDLQLLIRRCLEKDPRRRLRDIGDARPYLDGAGETSSSPVPQRERSTTWMAAVAAAAFALAALSGVVGFLVGSRATAPTSVTPLRFAVSPPAGAVFYDTVETLTAALAPDGSQFAFIAGDAPASRRIWVRRLGAVDARPIAGTEDASSVFWSPDSRSIGFVAGGRLRRVDVESGAPVTVCEVPTGVGFFASWGRHGRAVFASIEGPAIFEVAMAGGRPVEVARPRPDAGEVRTFWPTFLPDGERFLYIAVLQSGEGRVMLAEEGQSPRVLFEALSTVQYVEPGFVLFVRDSGLMAQPFDAASGTVTGEQISLGERVRYMYGPGRALFTASQTGLLAFNSSNDRLELRWVSRDGRPTGTVATAALRVRISPDGRRALFDRVAADTGAIDVYSIDLERGAEEPLTSSPYPEGPGAWLPDGRSVFMMIARGGPPRIVRKDFTSGVEEPVLPPAGLQEAEDVTADGQYLVYSERTSGQYDIWALPLAGTPKRVPVVVGPFSEFEARVSRDGQQVAYVSLESGQSEVYVTPFLRTGARTLVSVGGGRRPRWSRDGRSLYYISGEQELIHVPVTTAPSFRMGAHVKAFPPPVGNWTNYDIAPDGRFLALVAESLAGTQPWTVWTHWPDAIARR